MSSKFNPSRLLGTLSILPPELRHIIYKEVAEEPIQFDILNSYPQPTSLQNLRATSSLVASEVRYATSSPCHKLAQAIHSDDHPIEYIMDLRPTNFPGNIIGANRILQHLLVQLDGQFIRTVRQRNGTVIWYPSINAYESPEYVAVQHRLENEMLQHMVLFLNLKDVKVAFPEEEQPQTSFGPLALSGQSSLTRSQVVKLWQKSCYWREMANIHASLSLVDEKQRVVEENEKRKEEGEEELKLDSWVNQIKEASERPVWGVWVDGEMDHGGVPDDAVDVDYNCGLLFCHQRMGQAEEDVQGNW